MNSLDFSIIVATYARPDSLAQTLESIASGRVPSGWKGELIVVDNGTMTETRKVVESVSNAGMDILYRCEPSQGKSRACNTAIGMSRGKALVFTDDDLRLPHNWIEGMCGPILAGASDAVAGGVRLAPHLVRPWFKVHHRDEFADTFFLDPNQPQQFVGANMAIARAVFDKIPAFDTEIGPGALGYYEDTLIAWQILRAGFRLTGALDIEAEHHFEESRLLRKSFVSTQIKRGQSVAYLDHHWRHVTNSNARLMLLERRARLAYGRLTHLPETIDLEGIAYWELVVVRMVAYLEQYLKEIKRPRNYDEMGLVKLP